MAFIRRRLNPNTRNYSHQLIETYRVAGQVKQRVLANLGRFETIDAALASARENLRQWKAAPPHDTRWYRGVRRRYLEQVKLERAKDISRAQSRVTQLESVVSKLSTRVDILDTTSQPSATAGP